jgi:hypothetical protein
MAPDLVIGDSGWKPAILVWVIFLIFYSFIFFALNPITVRGEKVCSTGDICQHGIDWHDQCKHYDLRQDVPQPGMHLICGHKTEDDKLILNVIADGISEDEFIFAPGTTDNLLEASVDSLLTRLYDVIGTSNGRTADMWRMFTLGGDPIYTINKFIYEGSAVIYTNGLWIWPAVRVGHVHTTPEGFHLETLSLRPVILSVAGNSLLAQTLLTDPPAI